MIVPATTANIARAARLIRAGEAVAFPTETVYGLGADATNAVATARIFEIKRRPSFDPLIVHIASFDTLAAVAGGLPEPAARLVRRYWPGPLTIVLPKRDAIPDVVTAGLASVAVRMPDHPVALELIERSGCPIAAPSANRFGAVSPTTAQHVAEQLGDQVPLVLDGGACRVGVESTVVSFVGHVPRLLRPGGVTLEELREHIGEVDVVTASDPRLAPGQLARHYAPRTPLRLVTSVAAIRAGERSGAALLLPGPAPDVAGFVAVEVLSPAAEPREAAANLFAAMRRLDAGGYTCIFAVAVEDAGLGRAIMDRLRRAAHG